MLEAVPITQARQNFMPLIERVGGEKYKFMVTRQGKPVAVVLSYEEYSRMVDTLLLSLDSKFVERVKRGLREIRQGKMVPFPDVSDV